VWLIADHLRLTRLEKPMPRIKLTPPTTIPDEAVAPTRRRRRRRSRKTGAKIGRPRLKPTHPEKGWFVLVVEDGKPKLVYDEVFTSIDKASAAAEGWLNFDNAEHAAVQIVETIKIGRRSAVKFENAR
jgi:hypothetical protein